MKIYTFDLQTDNMSFAQALFFSEHMEKSIVPKRYSKEAKEHVQFYINPEDGLFYCQDYDHKARQISANTERQGDRWELFEGTYAQYHSTLAFKKKRLRELAEELGINLQKVAEFQKLRKYLQDVGELDVLETFITEFDW